MNLWVDDLRSPPEGWTLAISYVEAAKILNRHRDEIEAISLDHDLGEGKTDPQVPGIQNDPVGETGYDVLKYMEIENIWPAIVALHTSNPVGKDNMKRLIDSTELYSKSSKGSIGEWQGVDIYFKKHEHRSDQD